MLMVRRGEESKRKRIEGEQRRRSDIRDLLDALKAVLPPDSSQPGNYGRAQSETLQHAANHIEYLSATSVGLQERVAALQAVYEGVVKQHEQLTGKHPAPSLDIMLPRSSKAAEKEKEKQREGGNADDADADADADADNDDVEMLPESQVRKGKQKSRMDRHLHTFPVEASTSSSSHSSSQQQPQPSPPPPTGRRVSKQHPAPSSGGGTRRASKGNRYDPISRGSRPSTSKRRETTPPPPSVQPKRRAAAAPRIVSASDPSSRVILHPPSAFPSSSISPPPPSLPLRLPSLNQESPPPARRLPSLNLHSPHREPLPSPYRPPPLVTPAAAAAAAAAAVASTSTIGPARTVRKPSMRYDPIRDVHIPRPPRDVS